MRIERVGLEHHRHVAGARREVGDIALADEDGAVGDLLEAGDHPQQCRLAATRGADEHEELPIGDLERDVVDRGHVLEGLADMFEANLSHRVEAMV